MTLLPLLSVFERLPRATLTAVALATTTPIAVAAPPEFTFFDPPAAPAGGTAVLKGNNLADVEVAFLTSTWNRMDATAATTISESQLTFLVPSERLSRDGIQFNAFAKNSDGVALILPASTPFLTIENSWEVSLEPIVQVAGPSVQVSAGTYQTMYVHPGTHLALGDSVFEKAHFFVKAGATFDYSALNFGIRGMTVYYEPGATIVGPGPLFVPEGPVVFEEVPVINTFDTVNFTRDPTPPVVTLTVDQTPDGTVTYGKQKPTYYQGDQLTFTATPDPGASFTGWAPPFQDQPNPFTLELAGATTVAATFTTGFTLTTTPSASGEITLEPDIPRYQLGQQVTATFTTLPGHTFDAWTGDLDSTENPHTFTITGDTTVTASTTAPASLTSSWSWSPPQSPPPGEEPGDFFSQIAIAPDGTLVVGYVPEAETDDGYLYAINPGGEIKWQRTLTVREVRMSKSRLAVPRISPDGNIVVTVGSSVHAINPADGATVWERQFIRESGSRPSAAVMYALSIAADGALYLSSHPHGLTKISPLGTPVANLPGGGVAPYPFYGNENNSIALDGTVHCTTSLNWVHTLYSFAPDLGTSLGQTTITDVNGTGNPDYDPSAITADGQVIRPYSLAPGKDRLIVFAQDGEPPREIPGTTGVTRAPVITQSGALAYPDSTGDMVAFDLTTDTELWRLSGFANEPPIALADGSVLALGANLNQPAVYKIDAAGDIVAHFVAPPDPHALPPASQRPWDGYLRPPAALSVAPDGTIYAAFRNGTLHAIDGDAPIATSTWPKAHGNIDNNSRVHPLAPVVTAELEADTSTPDTVVLTFAYDARPAPFIEWLLDGEPVPGATGTTLTIDDPTTTDLGTYVARITNTEGNAETQPLELSLGFTLTVPDVPHVEVGSSHPGGPVEPGSVVTLTATPAPGFDFVRWEGDVDSLENPLQLTVDSSLTVTPVVADVTPPVIKLDTPAGDTTAVGDIILAGTVSDNDSLTTFTWSANGSPPQPVTPDGATYTVSGVPLKVGPNTIHLDAADPSGNSVRLTKQIQWLPPRTVASDPTSTVEGDSLTLPLGLLSEGDVGGLTLRISYDPTYLGSPDVEFTELLASAFKSSRTDVPGEIQLSFAFTGTAVPAGDAGFATIGFRARSVTDTLTTHVSYEILDIADGFGTPFAEGNGAITTDVTISPRQTTADINTNGRLDVGDAHRLQQLLVGRDEVRAWDIGLNDINGSGTLDAGDLIRVLRAAAGIDPQPQLPGPRIARLVSPLPAERLDTAAIRLAIENPGAKPGQTVTVRVLTGVLDAPTTGAAFALHYDPTALRLDGPSAHTTGDAVPPATSALWNVSPSINNYTTQTGRIAFAASSESPWTAAAQGTVIAELKFTVQPTAVSGSAYPVTMTAAEVSTEDGYATRPAPPQHVVAVPTPATLATWTERLFTLDQLVDPQVSGPGADPDGDGRSNLVEFFTGSSPLAADPAPVVRPVLFTAGGETFLGARFERSPATTASFTVQSATSLADWQSTGAHSLGTAELVSSTFDPTTGLETLTVRFPEPVSETPDRYLRLSIEEP